ncbi:MAG: ribosome-associated translation inhibitor RaiA [Oscillospiraceae bacterium]|jgi:putative sigma-54 modulation protein|nr:ribosome-associated translation inhibitor RaiA [Oscillospiraceae bacterium]
MKIEIFGKKLTPRDAFKERAEKKLGKVERLFGIDDVAKITARADKTSKGVEITLQKDGFIFRAQECAPDLEAALDKAVDVLIRQIRKNKTRLEKKLRTPQTITETFADEAPVAESQGKVVRVKHTELKPLSREEAVLQLELIGHDTFLFLDEESGRVSLLYARADGDYGLLVPDAVG